jgi:hypothetical protein
MVQGREMAMLRRLPAMGMSRATGSAMHFLFLETEQVSLGFR